MLYVDWKNPNIKDSVSFISLDNKVVSTHNSIYLFSRKLRSHVLTSLIKELLIQRFWCYGCFCSGK